MKIRSFPLLFIIVVLVTFLAPSKSASAHIIEQDGGTRLSAGNLQAEETPVPAVTVSQVSVDTQESRELPPVGSNAGLVIGASVLVLIIIGGVLSSRRRQKH
jgi:hypothetical protein